MSSSNRVLSPAEPQTKDLKFWIGAWLPVLIGIVIIVIESTETFGSNHTSGPLRRVWEALFGTVTDPRWEVIHHYIRKSGHFLGYGGLGLIWLRAWRMTLSRRDSGTGWPTKGDSPATLSPPWMRRRPACT